MKYNNYTWKTILAIFVVIVAFLFILDIGAYHIYMNIVVDYFPVFPRMGFWSFFWISWLIKFLFKGFSSSSNNKN